MTTLLPSFRRRYPILALEIDTLRASNAAHMARCDELQAELSTSKRETFETAVELRGALDSITSLERQLTAARERIDVLLDHGLGDVERASSDDEETTG
jgi:predicted  nucleic acid-binding Zn-ribbon protein